MPEPLRQQEFPFMLGAVVVWLSDAFLQGRYERRVAVAQDQWSPRQSVINIPVSVDILNPGTARLFEIERDRAPGSERTAYAADERLFRPLQQGARFGPGSHRRGYGCFIYETMIRNIFSLIA